MQNCVKVRFKDMSKMIALKKDRYNEFLQKVKEGFELPADEYYQLYFTNKEGKDICIISEADFIYLCEDPTENSSRLYLKKTDNPKLHFEGNALYVSTAYENNDELIKGIQKIKDNVVMELQKFRAGISKWIRQELKAKQEEKRERRARPSSEIVHYGIKCCQCHVQDIRGVRYECAICDYNICEVCEEQGYEHDPTHPLIKIKDETQMLQRKLNRLKKGITKTEVKNKKEKEEVKRPVKSHVDPKLIKGLMELSEFSESQAMDFIEKHPKKGLEELAELYFSSQI